ncbi:MAG: SDR family oxidoreductase [Polyangiaceae bacterium]
MTTALITGASAGLGTEYAWLFAEAGHDVVLVARRREKLDSLAEKIHAKHQVTATVLVADLTDSAAPQRIFAELEEKKIAIEFLVNNAGFGTSGHFASIDLKRELEMIQVNVTALVELTSRFLPAMITRKSGRILNIGSSAGFQPGPGMAGYYATKAYVNSFTEALAFELRGTGVTATVSCPGATVTEFADVANVGSSGLFAMGAMGAREVAQHGFHAMMNADPIAVVGIKNKLGVQSLRFAPRALVVWLAARLNRTPTPPALPAAK